MLSFFPGLGTRLVTHALVTNALMLCIAFEMLCTVKESHLVKANKRLVAGGVAYISTVPSVSTQNHIGTGLSFHRTVGL